MLLNKPFQLKICGITRLEDARYISGLMVDRLGFIFVKESRRSIEPGKAGAIIEWLGGIESVGVFMNQPLEEIVHIAKQTGLNWVQLHGEEPPFYCNEVPFPVIKTISISQSSTSAEIQEEVDRYSSVVEEYLFDTSISDGDSMIYGGTGIPFQWEILQEVSIHKPWHVAGGITPENLFQAWNLLKPSGFDLSSGVESEPGIKDFDLLDKLVHTIHQIED